MKLLKAFIYRFIVGFSWGLFGAVIGGLTWYLYHIGWTSNEIIFAFIMFGIFFGIPLISAYLFTDENAKNFDRLVSRFTCWHKKAKTGVQNNLR